MRVRCGSGYALFNTDCREVLPYVPDCSIDSLVTDPPAGIAFMNKVWDDPQGWKESECVSSTREGFIIQMTAVFRECVRVLKPGGHALVWALPRTVGWTHRAIEDAGFEIRDCLTHVFGQGFSKTGDLGKKDESLSGLSTSIRPAHENWILARKPIVERTVVANVAAYGTGALNIDACRIERHTDDRTEYGIDGDECSEWTSNTYGLKSGSRGAYSVHPKGRWPTNFILSHSPECEGGACAADCPSAELDRQSGDSCSHRGRARSSRNSGEGWGMRHTGAEYNDTGGASRFFFCAKASRKDRDFGLPDGIRNTHPTVKSTNLMRYLVRLITPINGQVLDPFMGSGSTGVAALLEGFRFTGMERDESYYEIAEARVTSANRALQRIAP